MKSVLDRQRGGALIVVMMVGLVITIGFAGFITSSVLVEARAVEGSLARSRAYWAEMGNFNYALSRISKSKFCSSCILPNTNIKDVNMAVNLQAYFNELTNQKTWTYPDESTSYTITITDTAAADNTAGRQQFSGWIMATSAYSSSSLVSGLNSHLPVMELRLCVGLFNSGSQCGNISSNNGGYTTAYFSINRLTNLPG
jgi:Tfp pilus assembly protein PilX